jgi:hypothetical protein
LATTALRSTKPPRSPMAAAERAAKPPWLGRVGPLYRNDPKLQPHPAGAGVGRRGVV